MDMELSHVKQLLAEYVLENYALKLHIAQLEAKAQAKLVPSTPPPTE